MIDLLRFERYSIRLRFTAPASFGHFLHGGVIHGLLGRALETRELPAGLVPAVPESGRVAYGAGEPYHFGLTVPAGSASLRADLERGLREIAGKNDLGRGLPIAGNFAVEEVEALPAVDLAAEVAALGERGITELRFVAPLRLERPAGVAEKGASYLDRRYFPLGFFLDRLWRRLHLLAHRRWPTDAEREAAMPPLPADGETDPSGLVWIDLPHPERGRTLGGALGRVSLSGLPESWLPFLVLGRHLHAGAATHFGFGRFVIGGLAEFEQPARSLYDLLAEPTRLARALEHVAEKSVAGGVDQISPERFSEERAGGYPSWRRRWPGEPSRWRRFSACPCGRRAGPRFGH